MLHLMFIDTLYSVQYYSLDLWLIIYIKIADRQLLVKCYDIKMVKSPYNCVIFPLTQPQVANQQQKKIGHRNFISGC